MRRTRTQQIPLHGTGPHMDTSQGKKQTCGDSRMPKPRCHFQLCRRQKEWLTNLNKSRPRSHHVTTFVHDLMKVSGHLRRRNRRLRQESVDALQLCLRVLDWITHGCLLLMMVTHSALHVLSEVAMQLRKVPC